MFGRLFNKQCECEQCKNKYPKRDMVKCRDRYFCSAACFVSFVTGVSHEELAALDLDVHTIGGKLE